MDASLYVDKSIKISQAFDLTSLYDWLPSLAYLFNAHKCFLWALMHLFYLVIKINTILFSWILMCRRSIEIVGPSIMCWRGILGIFDARLDFVVRSNDSEIQPCFCAGSTWCLGSTALFSRELFQQHTDPFLGYINMPSIFAPPAKRKFGMDIKIVIFCGSRILWSAALSLFCKLITKSVRAFMTRSYISMSGPDARWGYVSECVKLRTVHTVKGA